MTKTRDNQKHFNQGCFVSCTCCPCYNEIFLIKSKAHVSSSQTDLGSPNPLIWSSSWRPHRLHTENTLKSLLSIISFFLSFLLPFFNPSLPPFLLSFSRLCVFFSSTCLSFWYLTSAQQSGTLASLWTKQLSLYQFAVGLWLLFSPSRPLRPLRFGLQLKLSRWAEQEMPGTAWLKASRMLPARPTWPGRRWGQTGPSCLGSAFPLLFNHRAVLYFDGMDEGWGLDAATNRHKRETFSC